MNCGVLKTSEAWARNSTVRDSFMGNVLERAMLNTTEPGPSMLLRLAFPNWAPGGTENAAVLNHSSTVGFVRLTGCPVPLACKVPFVPRLMSEKLATTRGVHGVPEVMLQSPLHCQSP